VKKLVHILFVLAYLLPTIGFTVAHHFCGDTLVSTNVIFDSEVKEPVDCCGEEPEEDPCCTNQVVSYKLDDLHFASSKITSEHNYSDYILVPVETFIQAVEVENHSIYNSISHSPPGSNAYIINCTFLI
jgi:hypothetical protein